MGNARVSFGKNSAGALEITDANDYYPFGMNHLKTGNAFFGSGSYKSYKYNGKELQESGMYDYGARFYMPDIGRWGVVDPLAEKIPDLNPMMYANNNPIRFVDPDGMDWVEAANGDVSWRDDITAKNYKDKGVLQKGETYRGTYYERTKTWDNKKHKGLVLETYHTYKTMDYSPAQKAEISIEGDMRTSKLGDVTIDLNVTFENGKTKTIGSYDAVAGGFNNGAPENGEYTVDTYWNREPENGMYVKGMNKDGVGFSYFLNPQFDTGRSELRIHPDGNNEGTQGCIGLSGNKIVLTDFRNRVSSLLKMQKSIPTNIQINGNPNNNGRKSKFKSNGE